MMGRIFIFVGLCVGAVVLPFWIILIAAIVYAFYFDAHELLLIGVILDGIFGVSSPWLPVPALYTITMLGIIVGLSVIKPLLIYYEE